MSNEPLYPWWQGFLIGLVVLIIGGFFLKELYRRGLDGRLSKRRTRRRPSRGRGDSRNPFPGRVCSGSTAQAQEVIDHGQGGRSTYEDCTRNVASSALVYGGSWMRMPFMIFTTIVHSSCFPVKIAAVSR